ncbi:hypothetical protein [Candidatus Methanocrinis alkalitolerans]|nr:hypothetical protein [Candidatus Methanocrinis alkalitolerans]
MYRELFRIMIVLSVFAASSMASAEGDDLPETDLLEGVEGDENDISSLVDEASSVDGANATVSIEDDAAEMESDEIEEAGALAIQNGEGETAPEELSPEAEPLPLASPVGGADVGAPSSFSTSMKVLAATADLYVDLTAGKAYNDDRLVSMYLVGGDGLEEEFPGMVMIQFDLSGLEVGADDVAVLVLKAESVEKIGDEMAGIFMAPVTSEWSESSSPTALALNILATFFLITGGEDVDLAQVGMNFGSDEVFTFDVSEQLKGAEGGKISFLLLAVGDTDYKVTFKSRETGVGPSLIFGPYPAAPTA